MTILEHPSTHQPVAIVVRWPTEAPPELTSAPPSAPLAAPHADPSERSYARKVATAWLAGIPVLGTLVALAVLAVGDLGIGGAIAVGAFSGFWMAPLAGVVGIGLWSSEQHHGRPSGR